MVPRQSRIFQFFIVIATLRQERREHEERDPTRAVRKQHGTATDRIRIPASFKESSHQRLLFKSPEVPRQRQADETFLVETKCSVRRFCLCNSS